MVGLDNPVKFCKGEIGFINFVAKPVWDQMNGLMMGEVQMMFNNIINNTQSYEEMAEEEAKK